MKLTPQFTNETWVWTPTDGDQDPSALITDEGSEILVPVSPADVDDRNLGIRIEGRDYVPKANMALIRKAPEMWNMLNEIYEVFSTGDAWSEYGSGLMEEKLKKLLFEANGDSL